MEIDKAQIAAIIRAALADYHAALYPELEHLPLNVRERYTSTTARRL